MNEELRDFASEMYQMALGVFGATGGQGKAAEKALAMCDRACTVWQEEKLKGEQAEAEVGGLDLTKLSVNLDRPVPPEPYEARAQE